MATPLPLALTMGDPAGIGGDVTLAAWQLRQPQDLPAFFLIDDPARIEALAEHLGLDVPLRRIAAPEEAAAAFADFLPVLPLTLKVAVEPGRGDARNGGVVLQSIEQAVRLTAAGRAAAVVTNPIHKQVLYDAGFRHPGHTEYLASLAGSEGTAVMMLACPGLRVVPVTIHVALAQVPGALTRDLIVSSGRIVAAALRRDFAIPDPRLAVAGLNPHAGETGSIGREEIDIIAPAIETLRAEGIAVRGPAPADGLFHPAARQTYDAVLCMYHDQAPVPLKTIDFFGGVNITLGLPFIRTSPDHGTAFDIAGSGRATPSSLIAALHTARAMADARAESDRLGGSGSP